MENKNISIQVVTTKKEAKKLWLQYCTPKVVWDLWTVREIFIDVYKLGIFFVEAKIDGNPAGLLPLFYNSKKDRYEWTSTWCENSKPFVSDPLILDLMLKQVKGTIFMEGLDAKSAKLFSEGVRKDEDHFILNVKRLNHSWENFLMHLKKKKRQNLRRDIRSVDSLNPVFRYDDKEDLKHFVRLNKKQMRRKVQLYDDETISMFETDKDEIKIFRKLIAKSGKGYRARVIAVLINHKVVGVDFCLIYKNIYTAMLGGLDIKAVSGIGVYMNHLDIVDAISNKCDYVDFMMEDHHWKKSWFTGHKRYAFDRPHTPITKKLQPVKEDAVRRAFLVNTPTTSRVRTSPPSIK